MNMTGGTAVNSRSTELPILKYSQDEQAEHMVLVEKVAKRCKHNCLDFRFLYVASDPKQKEFYNTRCGDFEQYPTETLRKIIGIFNGTYRFS
jgi:hypothetical protein